MSTFFIPGSGEDRGLTERAYADMRDELERDLGMRPNPRRIAKLWSRRGSTDCVTEVGRPDPLHGGVVLAIFDIGPRRPFVVWWQPHGAAPTGLREVPGSHTYAAVEFDALVQTRSNWRGRRSATTATAWRARSAARRCRRHRPRRDRARGALLERRFGAPYLAYKRRVRRWI